MEDLSKKDIKINEWEYEFTQRNKHTILMADLWGRSYQHFQEKLGIPIPTTDYIFTASSKGFVKTPWKKKILNVLRENLDETLLQKMIDSMFKRIENLGDFIDIAISSNDLSAAWRKFDELYLHVIPWYYLPYYITTENMLTDKVKEGLQKHKKEIEKYTDLNHALLVLIFPIKEAIFQKEQKEFYELLRLTQNNPQFKKKAEKYLEEYGWMKTFVTLPIEPLSYEELVMRVKEGLKNKMIEDYELKQAEHKKNRELANKLMKILEKDKELTKWINWSREFGWFLTAGVESSLQDLARLIPFYKAIAKKIGVDYSDWNNFTSGEISRALEDQNILPTNQLKDRKKGYFYLMKDRKGHFVYGDKALELSSYIENNVGKIDQNITELKGQSASPGKAIGKVHISLFATDSHKIQQGEILVCSMTSPDYISAMKRSSAIVTDEGGLLSHAAIVGRELGKPVVVGTKISTKVLKNGDTVEVDANKGIIKILEKASN